MKKKLLGDKTYEQAIGFLRITEGTNVLDATAIHPESYDIALKLLHELNFDLKDVGSEALITKLKELDLNTYKDKLNTDIYTLEDIVASLMKPNRDPRDNMPQPLLKSDVLDINDLKVGMQLEGTVRNVVDFGAFVDIGLHNDGLVHISNMTDKYIKHPSEILSVGDIVTVYVKEIFLDKTYNADGSIDFDINDNSNLEFNLNRLKHLLSTSEIDNNLGGKTIVNADTIHFSNKYENSMELIKSAKEIINPEPVNYIKVKNSGWVE